MGTLVFMEAVIELPVIYIQARSQIWIPFPNNEPSCSSTLLSPRSDKALTDLKLYKV